MTEVVSYVNYIVITLVVLSLFVALSNLRSLSPLMKRSFNYGGNFNENGLVSVLIPARNEEDNIGRCLRALLAQDYRPMEILVLDDQSTDRTPEIISEISERDERVTLISGSELPQGWIGKNWACYQLSTKAKGEFLLFTDADTILSEGAVESAVMHAVNRGVNLLTVMPRRMSGCIIENLLFPFIDWIIFCCIPTKIAHRSRNSFMSPTFGQFMFFKTDSYRSIGGHAAVRANPLDDFELGRLTKKLGLTWMLFEGVNHVQVLPYRNGVDAFRGISRSLYPAAYYSLTVLLLGSVTLLMLSFIPLYILLTGFGSVTRDFETMIIAGASIGVISGTWLIVCYKFKHNMFTVFVYPIAMGFVVVVAIHSMITYLLGLQTWRNRRFVNPHR